MSLPLFIFLVLSSENWEERKKRRDRTISCFSPQHFYFFSCVCAQLHKKGKKVKHFFLSLFEKANEWDENDWTTAVLCFPGSFTYYTYINIFFYILQFSRKKKLSSASFIFFLSWRIFFWSYSQFSSRIFFVVALFLSIIFLTGEAWKKKRMGNNVRIANKNILRLLITIL